MADHTNSNSQDSNPEWYCRIAGEEHGPLSTEDILIIAQQGVITPDVPIKVGNEGAWMQAGTVQGLFTDEKRRSPQIANIPSTSAAASELLSSMNSLKFKRQLQACGTSGRRASRKTSLNISLSDVTIFIVDWVYTVGDALKLSHWLFNRKTGAVLALLAGIVAFFSLYQFDHFSRTEIIDTYVRILADHEALRDNKADEGAWDEFAEKTKQQLSPIVEQLNRQANVHDPAELSLLWIGRDFLPKTIRDARTAPSESEKQVNTHLQNVRLVTQHEKQPVFIFSSTTIITALIVFFDAVLLLWILNMLRLRISKT